MLTPMVDKNPQGPRHAPGRQACVSSVLSFSPENPPSQSTCRGISSSHLLHEVKTLITEGHTSLCSGPGNWTLSSPCYARALGSFCCAHITVLHPAPGAYELSTKEKYADNDFRIDVVRLLMAVFKKYWQCRGIINKCLSKTNLAR